MSGIYFTDLLDVLAAAGCAVAENATTAGWQTRARSSGGFPDVPLCCFMHHTASATSPANDLAYMIDGCPDAPVGNVLLDRTGTWWPIAAGASNCAGKGGPSTFSRGTIPLDSGNTRGFQVEAANNGIGERWPQAQVDAYFAGVNALNARFGNVPTDVISHAGYTSRKIDPATAAAVEGPWRPDPVNSSGTWDLDDIRDECSRRAMHDPNGDDDMRTPATVWLGGGRVDNFVTGSDGALWHNWYIPGVGWAPWETLGGGLMSSPSATGSTDRMPDGAPARIDVTGRGTDGALWHVWFDGQRWQPWERIDGWP